MNGPAGVMALVLAETAVGGLFVLWVTPTWGVLRAGFFKLTGAILAGCAVLAWLAARSPLDNGSGGGARSASFWLLVALAAAAVLWQVLQWTGAANAGRIVGIAAVPVGIAAFVALAALPAARRS